MSEQHDAHVWRRRRWRKGLDLADELWPGDSAHVWAWNAEQWRRAADKAWARYAFSMATGAPLACKECEGLGFELELPDGWKREDELGVEDVVQLSDGRGLREVRVVRHRAPLRRCTACGGSGFAAGNGSSNGKLEEEKSDAPER